jgi:NAD(P)-dependent dehydrogenase (short-subunit alcohol dehydrogenase family)
MEILDKVVLMTGAARIGRTVALALARRGADVALIYRGSKASAEETARAVRSLGRKAAALRADLSRPAGADAAVKAVLRSLGGVDILVHMASVYARTPWRTMEKDPSLAEGGPAAVDLAAARRLALQCAPVMRRRGGGRIVLFSDWTAAGGRPRYRDFLPYYVAKAGVKALTEALGLELAPDILVNAVAPGPILPPPGLGRAADREVRRATPLGRWGGTEEIAKAVLFFIESDFVTGECLRVDGGRHLL